MQLFPDNSVLNSTKVIRHQYTEAAQKEESNDDSNHRGRCWFPKGSAKENPLCPLSQNHAGSRHHERTDGMLREVDAQVRVPRVDFWKQ